MSKTCRACNAVSPSGARFCAECGAVLSVPQAERRLLTVVFCDLVGSTALSEMLDPEDMRDVLDKYQACCAEAVESAGGSIQQYLGDGVLIYFGYPQSHEDDARRAVGAALQIVKTVAQIGAGAGTPAIAARAGIHTGLALVGEVGRGQHRENLAVGGTPNVAARVQGEAPPHQVVITSATLELVQGFFETQDLGGVELKGIKGRTGLHRVLGQTRAERRIEVAAKHGLTPFVGHDDEQGTIASCWRDAQAGTGRALLLVGEPGIGKSRHVQTAKAHAARSLIMECFCSPDLRNSPLHPFTRTFAELFGFEEADAASARFAKIRAYADRCGLGSDEDLGLLANTMAVQPPPGHPPVSSSATRQYQRTLELVGALIRSRQAPLLLVVEDLHWADSSTIEAIGLLLNALTDTHLLLVATARPEFASPWEGSSRVTTLHLNRLGEAEVRQMILNLTSGVPLPADVTQVLIDRCEGVPLFVEEMTKTVLASGFLVMRDRQLSLQGASADHVIPATLLESLMARLDRLGGSKQMAQVASVFGRGFSAEILATVTDLPAGEFRSSLARLLEADFVRPEADGYIFKHSLLREAAYDSVPKSRRRELHLRVARTFESDFPDTVQGHPELVAHHWSAGGDPDRAAQLWLLAGQGALRRNALVEATGLLRAALAAIQGVPASPQRTLTELDVVLTLAASLINAQGYGTAEVAAMQKRAQELCASVDDLPRRALGLISLWMFEANRARHATALELATTAMELARAAQNEDLLLEAHMGVGLTNFYQANFGVAAENFEQVAAMYRPEAHASHRFQFGNDPASISLGYLSIMRWIIGDQARSLETSREALALAKQLRHPFSEMFALVVAGVHRILSGDLPAAEQIHQECTELCAREGIPAIFVALWAACVRAERGDSSAPEALQMAIGYSRMAGLLNLLPYIEAVRADALSARGDHAQAEERLAASLDEMETTGERWAEAEIHRLHALILERRGADGQDIEACYDSAIACAQRVGARGWEARAIESRGRWLAHRSGTTPDATRRVTED